MRSTEKFGAVRSRRQGAALRPPVFPNLTPQFGSGTRLTSSGFCRLLSPFLPGSASQVEIAVTYSKQRTAQILPGSRIAHKRSSDQSKFSSEFVQGARVAIHVSGLSPATSHSLARRNEGPLATAFRYNAPGPNFSREAHNSN
jgi:hypothetical protein